MAFLTSATRSSPSHTIHESVVSSSLLSHLPAYLRVLPTCQVLLCSQHGACYTRNTCERHLTDKHGVVRKAKKRLLDLLAKEVIVDKREEAVLPAQGGLPIDGLPVLDGYKCQNCLFLTTGPDEIQRHCSKVHQQTSLKAAQFKAAKLQTLWAEKKYIQYFEVVPRELNIYSANPESSTLNSTHPDSSQPPPPNARDELKKRFKDAQTKLSERYKFIGDPAHKSELTPWLRATGFHVHLAEFELETLPDSYALPKEEDDPQLWAILESVARILRKAMQVLGDDRYSDSRRINRHNAKILNTFRPSELSQRPLTRLQNQHSLDTYISTWQKLVCYYFRVTLGDALRDDIFVATDSQNESLIAVMKEIAAQRVARENQPQRSRRSRARRQVSEPDSGSEFEVERDDKEKEEAENPRQAELDELVLAFCVALIQQPLLERAFDSPIISFAAALAWDPKEETWMKINNYSSYLSCLIYDCQLIVTQHSLSALDNGETNNLTRYVTKFCKQWLLNDSQSPMAELLAIRLLAFAIGKTTVNQAQIRWHQDGETLVYNDVRYSMSDLRSEIRQGIDSAHRILYEDLCLGLDGVPPYDIKEVQDNWDSSKPGASFLTDIRNADLLDGGDSWIFDHLTKDPDKSALFLKKDANDHWGVDSDAAKQYEHAVQLFLQHMLVLIHKASGQPARKPEFLGLRWCNKGFDKRNLFVHDGYMLFVLTYHKAMKQTNASRWPVRFLLPEVAQLLMQYLVLVMPFRRWLKEEVMIPDDVSEYLWSSGKDIWSENHMTKVLKSESRATIGVEIHAQAWRQITVGIALKKFAGKKYQTDLDINGDLDEDEEEFEDHGMEGGSIPNAFHWQAAHTPRTGNQIYGGTINFREGLTDAGVQEYLRASQMWHGLCRDPVLTTPLRPTTHQVPSHTAHRRMLSAAESPLPKKIARRQAPLRHHRRWTTEDGIKTLRRLYGEEAQYRTPAQEQLMKTILDGVGQIIGILGTGEGKSLSFMLPPRLPGAGTTVAILPLVALKQDQIRQYHDMNIEYYIWTRSSRPEEVGHPLIFVSMEQAVRSAFKQLLFRLDVGNSLDRIILDESHLVLTASKYRPKFRFLEELRELRCQFVFLTATLPPMMMSAFQKKLLLVDPHVIRSLTIRRDITYHVTRSTTSDVIAFAVDMVQQFLREPWVVEDERARVIIYVLTRAEVDVVAEALNGLRYYSDSGTVDEKAAFLQQWVDGVPKIMVATSAFGPGVNYPCVRGVFHIGVPDNAIDFAQEVGRAGRDGKGGVSSVFLARGREVSTGQTSEELLPAAVKVMRAYLNQPRCRAAVLSQYMDGVTWYCEDPDMCCDQCLQKGLRKNEGGVGEEEAVEVEMGVRESGKRVDDEEDEDEDEGEGSEVEDLEVGARVLHGHIRDRERAVRRYVESLRALQGRCVICRLDGIGGFADGVSKGDHHSFPDCRDPMKYRFFDAKKKVIAEGKRRFERPIHGRMGWLAMFTACFKCGNPQPICPQQGSGECPYRDIVFPICYAVYQWEFFRKELQRVAERRFENENEYMMWLGEERLIHGLQASNAMMMTDWVMKGYLCV